MVEQRFAAERQPLAQAGAVTGLVVGGVAIGHGAMLAGRVHRAIGRRVRNHRFEPMVADPSLADSQLLSRIVPPMLDTKRDGVTG